MARGRLSQLQTFQTELEGVWRTSRWLTDAIAWARDKSQVRPATGASLGDVERFGNGAGGVCFVSVLLSCALEV